MTLLKVNNPVNKGFDGLVNELFNEFQTGFGKAFTDATRGYPAVNIVEKEKHYELHVVAPGFDKADFSVKLDERQLTIGAEKKTAAETGEKALLTEHRFRSFKRSFTIDDTIDTQNIQAQYENGILVVNLPKKAEVLNGSKEITIL
jgi:HSP20 family protein